MPRVSVLVTTYNGAARLPLLFAALDRQTLPRDQFEVVVADDHSSDDTAAVAAAHPGVRVITAPESYGQPRASNLGLTIATAPVIAFTDDDTVPAADWLERGLARMDATPSGLFAGRIVLQLPEPPTAAALVDLGRGYLNQEDHVAEGYGATANLWARRDVLDALGGFDARFLAQGHDRDFGERALEAGIVMAYAEDVTLEHPARSRARDIAKVSYRLGRGAPELRNHSVGRLTTLKPFWRQSRYYRPWRTIWGLPRVREHGYSPTLAQRLQMRAITYTCIQLPLVAGSIAGEKRERARRRAEA
ncbi:MAG: glycosyltransferase [Conexibacter sp.]|nr:glycosyltransferase [Conexibacter sp.]